MAKGYFASKISENLLETPEGYLVAPGCVIARDGWQTYQTSDLPQEAAKDLGVDVSNPSASIDLYRDPSDVFKASALASGEGKPICDQHPPDFVSPENFTEYARGHIQNVRKGTEPLESGDWPMLADLVITAEPLLSKVKNKILREISLGYDYSIRRDGDKICQSDIVINHCAIVPKGRAGHEARIEDAAGSVKCTTDKVCMCNDSAPKLNDAAPERASPPPAGEQGVKATNATATKKEKLKVKNNLLHILGLGLKAKANDADTDPEELAQAAKDIGEKMSTESDDRRARDKRRGRDEFEGDPDIDSPPDYDRETGEDKRRGRDRKGDDRRSDDRRSDDRHMDDRRARDKRRGRDEFEGDPDIDSPPDYDREEGDDARRRAHDLLDRMLDRRADDRRMDDRRRGRDRKARDRRGDDADIEALRELLDDFLSEEEQEPEHSMDRHMDDEPEADPTELENVLSADSDTFESEAGEDDEADPGQEIVESGEEELEPGEDAEESELGECAHCGTAHDEANCPECGCKDRKADDRHTDDRKAKDRARAADGAAATLKMLRPVVARSNDVAVKKAFNKAFDSLNKVSRASSGSYAAFGSVARARDKAGSAPAHARVRATDSNGSNGRKDPITELQAAYDAALKGGK